MNLYHRIRKFLPGRINYPVVLMYHRIASPAVDPWELSVSKENFEQQLQVLKQTGFVVSLNGLVEQVYRQRQVKPCIAITFDDGYADNYLAAKPLLETYGLPATFFIASGYTETKEMFWWDELDILLLVSEKLPKSIAIPIGGEPFEFHLAEDAVLSERKQEKQKHWMYEQPPPTKRCELYLAIWERLKPLSSVHIQTTLEAIRQWAGLKAAPDAGSIPMTRAQLGDMASNPLFEIGIHTVTHCDLRFGSAEQQRREIATCRETLNHQYGLNVNTLAYPYGKYNHETLSVVKALGINAAFTTEGEVVMPESDPHQAGRFQVKNWDGKQFKKQLLRWLKNN